MDSASCFLCFTVSHGRAGDQDEIHKYNKMEKALALSFLAAMITFSCGKNDENPKSDVIPQFLEFTVNDQPYYFTEDDSTAFILIPGFDYSSDKPDSLFFGHVFQIQILHPQPDGSAWGEAVTTKLHGRYHKAQTVTEGNCQRLQDGIFDSFFSTGDRTIPGGICQNGFFGKAISLDMTLNIQGAGDWNSHIYDSNCTGDSISQVGSYFTIDSTAVYEHPVHGEGLMLSGRFEMNQISGQTGEIIRLKNGKFRLCAIKCR